jgi:hypothetical protein
MEDDVKRFLCAMVVVIALVFSVGAQGSPGGAPVGDGVFVGRIKLDVGIARLAEIARLDDAATLLELSADSSFILFGTLSRPSIESDQPFWAISEFLEGEWIGTSEIRLHRVFLLFVGEAYREFLDGSAGMRALAIVKDATLRANKDGTKDVYLSVVSIRPFF